MLDDGTRLTKAAASKAIERAEKKKKRRRS
jgi:hypothetical protein